jgi:hypothetical protein
VDPQHLDVDPDSTCHPNADSDADLDSVFYLMQIWMRFWIFI